MASQAPYGAMTLAIAAVIGGNSLDALNLVVGDIAFRSGPPC
ncbi:hypothetical protein [Nonomuraea sp. SYSU D8015]|nr:hypothetical protein [Nonomuraea sp. SYSU D8015]